MRAISLLLLVMLVSNGLNLVVTFPSLAGDVKLLACSSDRVISVVPAGVDPHDYELKPEDIEVLRKADLIISTAHTPFEKSIREMSEEFGSLLEIPKVVRVKVNPATGTPNYHMPIYDPENYLLFMRTLKYRLEELHPSCRGEYESKFDKVEERVRSLEDRARSLNISINALATTPLVQYAVEWTGIKVKYLIIKEADVPATPQDLLKIREAAQRGEIQVVVLMEGEPEQVSKVALEIARDYGLPHFTVPSPLDGRTIPEKLEEILNRVESMRTIKGEDHNDPITTAGILALIIAVSVVMLKIGKAD